MSRPLSLLLPGLVVILPALASAAPQNAVGAGSVAAATQGKRLVEETPDATIADHGARLTGPGTEADQLASLAVIASFGDRAGQGVALDALKAAAASEALSPELRSEAATQVRAGERDEGTQAGLDKARNDAGILTNLSILGPFRDTGGGLDAHDGPEEKKSAAGFGDPKTSYSWGTVEVGWRAVPPTFAQARASRSISS